MTSRLIISPNARMDLIGIGIYTEKQWGKRQRKKYLNQLESKIRRLAKNPAQGRQHHELPEAPYGYHEGRHVIFYRLTSDGIEIIRILHDSMDFLRHFD
ncbi:type II toxin-antitoxin system RelE/ParE family toxin [candidate division KSB1 bacterium]|nr:type II toxin-antitoxin system RelE/ParE family toxin [candidate division KSB1 bacterium]